jgi:adenylosuccinate lyase
MPHKKNPITGEKLCGLARILRGNLVAALENVALWHERDISHSSVERIIVPDGTIALDHMLVQLEKLVRNLVVYPGRMQENLDMTHGLIHSQQVLLMLTKKGFTREQAYRMVQRHALQAWESHQPLRTLIEADAEIMAKVTAADLDNVFDLSIHFRDVNRTFKAVGL